MRVYCFRMAGDTYVPRRPPELPRSERHPAPHRKPPTPRWVFHVRRAVALLILALLIFGVVRACGRGEQASGPTTEPAAETTTAATAGTAAPTTQNEAPPEIIDQSRPVEMRIPAVGLTAKFEDADCRVVDGAIDPGPLNKACAYTSVDKPYQLPGTHTSDVVVLAGHAAAGVPAVFDKLYNPSAEEHTLKVGDVMYLRTAESGDWWLKYQVTDLHDPDKSALADDPAIWGTQATPGRLLTISCVQPANPFEDSVRNAVIGWRFEGVSLDDAS